MPLWFACSFKAVQSAEEEATGLLSKVLPYGFKLHARSKLVFESSPAFWGTRGEKILPSTSDTPKVGKWVFTLSRSSIFPRSPMASAQDLPLSTPSPTRPKDPKETWTVLLIAQMPFQRGSGVRKKPLISNALIRRTEKPPPCMQKRRTCQAGALTSPFALCASG